MAYDEQYGMLSVGRQHGNVDNGAARHCHVSVKKTECSFCAGVPVFIKGKWDRYESAHCIASGAWVGLYSVKDEHNRLAIYGISDEITDFYYPKFCPECGRKLKER